MKNNTAVREDNITAYNLRDYLERNNISIKDLSMKIGIPEKSIRLKLSGKKPLYVDDLVCFCRALNIQHITYITDYRKGLIRDIMLLVEKLSNKNLKRLIAFGHGLTINGE